MRVRVIIAVAVLLACIACGTNRPRVGVVGDSITSLAEAQIHRALDPKYDVTVESYPGFTTAQILAFLKDEVAHHSESEFVVNAGSNDVMQNKTGWQTDYDQIINIISQSCGVLVNVNPLTDVVGNGSVKAEQVNVYIHHQVATHPHFRFVDWVSAAKNPAFVLADGVHPSPLGQAWLGDAYRRALDSC